MDVPTVGAGNDQVSQYLDTCAAIIAYGVMTLLALIVMGAVFSAVAAFVSLFNSAERCPTCNRVYPQCLNINDQRCVRGEAGLLVGC